MAEDAASRTGLLFYPGEERPHTPLVEVARDPVALRTVYWSLDENTVGLTDEEIDERANSPHVGKKPCLVRCELGQRNIRTIRKLVTICGQSCEPAVASSGQPLTERESYCNACAAGAGTAEIR